MYSRFFLRTFQVFSVLHFPNINLQHFRFFASTLRYLLLHSPLFSFALQIYIAIFSIIYYCLYFQFFIYALHYILLYYILYFAAFPIISDSRFLLLHFSIFITSIWLYKLLSCSYVFLSYKYCILLLLRNSLGSILELPPNS